MYFLNLSVIPDYHETGIFMPCSFIFTAVKDSVTQVLRLLKSPI